MHLLKTAALSIGSLLLTAGTASADGTWSVGAFAGVTVDYYIGGDRSDIGVGPFLAYDTERLHLGFDGASYNFIARPDLTVGAGLSLRAEPDFPGGALFSGLDRGTAVEAGVFARQSLGESGYIGGGLRRDISSEHGGYEADLHVGTQFALGRVGVDASIGGKFRDGDLNHYLVGVSASEANGDRSAYDPGSSFIPYVGLTASVPLSDKVTLVGAASYEHLGSTYEDSPLVERNKTGSLGVGLVYQF
ncbi:MipA/OmpV family protein [Jannaschia marina]|uniref:MipA/OmpV family protein n=1 Tax=Jannaschia marina TaxID=2741674 RepID=UPI0015C9CD93|nr:MipA/OmpV family protein [Jannaschia marina]